MSATKGRCALRFTALPSRLGSTGVNGDNAAEHGYLLTSILTVAMATGQAIVKFVDGQFLLLLDDPCRQVPDDSCGQTRQMRDTPASGRLDGNDGSSPVS